MTDEQTTNPPTTSDTVVHVVMTDGTEHWGSPYGVLAEHVGQPPAQQPAVEQPEPAGEPAPVPAEAEVTSDGAALPAPSEDHDTGTAPAGPGDAQ